MNRSTRLSFSRAIRSVTGLSAGFHFHPEGAVAEPPPKPKPEPLASMREEFTRLQTEAEAIIETAAAENREIKPDEQKANEAKFARMTAIKSVLDEHSKFAAMAIKGDSGARGRVIKPTEPPGKPEFEASMDRATFTEGDDIDREEFGKATGKWLLSGEMDRKFATITTATQSSILLPKNVLPPLAVGAANAFREGYQAWGLDPMSTPGDTSTINIPVLDPAAGGLVAENAGSETENAPTLSQSIISTVKTYQSGSVYYSNLQLAATSYDLLGATGPTLEFNKELGLESAIAAAIIADSGITQSVATATSTTVTFANFVSLDNVLPKRYQKLKVIALSAAAYAAAAGIVDSQGRPIMIPDVQNQSLKRLFGNPVVRCDYLESFGLTKVIGAVFSLIGFHLRDCGQGITRYNQNAAKPNQTGMNLFGYHAFGYAVSAIATLKTPSS